MTRSPTLRTTVPVRWEDRKLNERECEVAVEFTFDGVDDCEVLCADVVGGGEPYGIASDLFDQLVDEAVFKVAGEVYGNWMSDQFDSNEEN